MGLAIASPDHIGRVLKVMKREGFHDAIPLHLPTTNRKAYLDPHCLYWSMRIGAKLPGGAIIFRLRELAARLLFLKNGWI
jgi:hypothetical protein